VALIGGLVLARREEVGAHQGEPTAPDEANRQAQAKEVGR